MCSSGWAGASTAAERLKAQGFSCSRPPRVAAARQHFVSFQQRSEIFRGGPDRAVIQLSQTGYSARSAIRYLSAYPWGVLTREKAYSCSARRLLFCRPPLSPNRPVPGLRRGKDRRHRHPHPGGRRRPGARHAQGQGRPDPGNIARQNPGQTILDTINAGPGRQLPEQRRLWRAGGTLTIRGFDSTRVSLTFDGIQLNDSGNYAIFSNQQIDPELIEQVNVNLGTTDVDSPTASAVGGTVNLRTRTPAHEVRRPRRRLARRIRLSAASSRSIDTGEIGPWGTRAFFAVSNAQERQSVQQLRQDRQAAVQRQDLSADRQQRRLRLRRRPLQPEPQQFLRLAAAAQRPDQSTTAGSAQRRPGSRRYPRNGDEREYDINYPCLSTRRSSDVADAPTRATSNRCRQRLRHRVRPALQPVEHRQHPQSSRASR